MIDRILVVLSLVAVLFWVPGCDNSADAQAVRDCWRDYNTASNDLDGENVAGMLSEASFARYANLKNLALDADANQVKVLSPWDQIEVLYMRAGLTRSQLLKLDARAFVIHAVNKGWWANEDVAMELGAVKIRKDVASAKVKDSVGDVTVEFVREDGKWKFDEPASDRYFTAFLSRVATRLNITETDLAVKLVDMEFGPQNHKKLFEPMR